jgi:Polymer-forming cytoskeletal
MQIFTRKAEPAAPANESARPPVVPGPSTPTFMPTQSGPLLSRGVSIKGSVKFLNELLIDGEVEGTIDSTGTLTIGEHASIRGDIMTKSVKVRGTVEGNILVTERCELQAGRSVSLGRQGRLDYVFRHLCFPAFKPLPKVFLKPVGYLSFSSAADLDHDVPWGLGREAPLVREPEGCAPRCKVGQGCGEHRR